jgi:hypothetical protein
MGKKSSLKKILRLCKNLPSIPKTIHEYHIVKGVDLIAEYGTNEMPNGDIINPDKTYKVPMPVITEINHKKNIKYIYSKGGAKGTTVYIDAVIDHIKNN